MKSSVCFYWKNPRKPDGWGFLSYCILQCLLSIFSLLLSLSNLEMMRHWQVLQWHLLIFFCHSLSCYFKITSFTCHSPSHLNFSLFPRIQCTIFGGKHVWGIFSDSQHMKFLFNWNTFCFLPTLPWANYPWSGKQIRAKE